MRQFLLALFAFALFGAAVSPAAAQIWPERPVTMVIPFPPGGGTDLLGRIVAKGLSEVLGQQVVVENVGGAGGMLGSARVVKSAPDGYTMVVGTTADAINQTLYKAPLYNFATDLVPAGLMGNQPTVLLARKDFPANTLQEFAAYVRANPSSVQFGSAGAGSTGHLFCELLNAALGIKNVTHVPYRGGGPAMQDLIAGRYDYICTLSPTGKPFSKATPSKASPFYNPNARRRFRTCPVRPSRACLISMSALGLASSSQRARPSRSSAGSMRRLRRPSTRRGCTSGSKTSSRT